MTPGNFVEIYPSAVGDEVNENSKSFELYQNYPNPFNPSTTINYKLPEAGYVSIKIFNTLGKEIKELVNGQQSAGEHSVNFSGEGLASGVYFYTVRAGENYASRKMVLTK